MNQEKIQYSFENNFLLVNQNYLLQLQILFIIFSPRNVEHNCKIELKIQTNCVINSDYITQVIQ